MDIKIVSVIFGCLLLSAVIFKYVQKDSEKQIVLTCFLTVFGFALVASPAWTSISFKSSEVELELINETTDQMDSYVRIIEGYDARLDAWTDESARLAFHELDLGRLAEELESQKNKIEQARSQGNIELALMETQKGTEIISKIAHRISGR